MVTYDHTFNVTGRPIAYFNAGQGQTMDAGSDLSERPIPQVDVDDDQVLYLDLLSQLPAEHSLPVLVENGTAFWTLASLRGREGVLITPQYPFGIGAVLRRARGGNRWLDQPHTVDCDFRLTEDGS
jgi:hypothetical protein